MCPGMALLPAVHSAAMFINYIYSVAVFKAVYISTSIQCNVLISTESMWLPNHGVWADFQQLF